MDYAEARPKIKTGDLLAWTHRGWRTWYDWKIQAVRILTRSEYCHVGIAWVVEEADRVYILESVVPKVRIYPLSLELPFFWIPMGKELSREAMEFAQAQVGEPYSQIRAALAFLGLLDRGDQNKWECAEYAAKVLEANGIDYGEAYTPTQLVYAAMEDDKVVHLVTK